MLLSNHSHSPVELQSERGGDRGKGNTGRREDVTSYQEEKKPNDTKELNLSNRTESCGLEVKNVCWNLLLSFRGRKHTHTE